ncbi:MAG TPA: NCS1 family nucleobase:cation symporter-1 [Kiritimatiellia bacterium]|nr:NCS1 family nucleobase:cation symporter-1 [Kiritimatiellia bacterium]
MSELESDLSPSELTAVEASALFNRDLAPIPSNARRWKMVDIAHLWVGMSVCIPTYMLASGLIAAGMNWWQAIITVSLGNLIVLIPMILNGHAGTKYGITFPVFARASFGVHGTHIASVLRAVVACGWFGIQTWIGGSAIYELARLQWPGISETAVIALFSNDYISVNVAQFICFLVFWAINIAIFWRGMESIRHVENWGAPLLIGLGVALLVWAYINADGFGPMLSQPDKFETRADFWKVFFPSLTAMVGFWATLSLNIPDFTREARSQRDQMVGQFLGLNTTMPFYAFVGVAVTSATVVIFGEAIWDPVQLLARFDSVGLMIVSMFALTLATLTTNLAANVVAPSTAFSNFLPRAISLRVGGVITGIIGILMQPWKLVADPEGYIFTWLIGYSGLLGPIGGILVCDYFLIRRTKLNLPALYDAKGVYKYTAGINPAAIIALVVAILPNIPGFLTQIDKAEAGPFWTGIYNYAWFNGFFIAMAVYFILMKAGAGNRERTQFRRTDD